jgi:aspartate/methionine/tyrosine aminotransferase
MNAITRTLEKIQKEKGFINLIASNFLDFVTANKIGIPSNILISETKKYFSKHSYNPDPKGLAKAREAISKYYNEEGLIIDQENIIITASTSESYGQIFSNFTKPNQEVLFPNPSYPLFEYLAKYANITPKFYKLDEENHWMTDIQGLEKLINKNTKGIVLISPNNPTGMIMSEEEIEQIEIIASKHNLFIIFDEVFSEFRSVKKFPRPMGKHNTTIFILNGISKMLALPDLKLAWISLIGPKTDKIIDQLETSNDTYLNANYLAQYILPTILPYRKEIAKNVNLLLNKNRKTLQTFLANSSENFEGEVGNGGIHNVIRIKSNIDEDSFVLNLLKEKKLSVHPGYFYDIAHTKGSSHIVISHLNETIAFTKGLEGLFPIKY